MKVKVEVYKFSNSPILDKIKKLSRKYLFFVFSLFS